MQELPADMHRKLAQLCMERMQDASDPHVRAWWLSVAQQWHERAMAEDKGLAHGDTKVFIRR